MGFKRNFLILPIVMLFFTLHFSVAAAKTTTPISLEYQQQENIEIPILMYHHFVEDVVPEGTEGSIMSIEVFRQQLMYLQEKGFHAISLSQLKEYLTGGTDLPPNPFVITIDDGYESNYTLAYPILKELNMSANINIVVSSRGKKPGKYQHFSWADAQEMLESGLIEIGSHTYDLHHAMIRMQPEEDLTAYSQRIYEDFKLSRDLIREHLAIEPYIYCPPYGIYNETSQSIAEELGFTLHLTTRPGLVTKESDLLALERINVRGDYTPEDLLKKIYSFKRDIGKEDVEVQQEKKTIGALNDLFTIPPKLPFLPSLHNLTIPVKLAYSNASFF